MWGASGQAQGAATSPEQLPLYELRRYDPRKEYVSGRPHKTSNDLVSLQEECGLSNARSSLEAGFKQWWIVDGQGKIVYPLETRPGVYVSPAAELGEVLQPFQEMRGFRSADVLHDFLFLTSDVDGLANAERLRLLARELEQAAAHICGLLEGQPVPGARP